MELAGLKMTQPQAKYLKDYIDKLDCLILGCTHYPIIKDEINDFFVKSKGFDEVAPYFAASINMPTSEFKKIFNKDGLQENLESILFYRCFELPKMLRLQLFR